MSELEPNLSQRSTGTLVREPCSTCRGVAEVWVVERVRLDGELEWSLGTICSRCGAAVEADAVGEVTEPYRSALLRQDGVWEVIVCEVPRVQLARVARELFELSVGDAAGWARAAPGVVLTGTRGEARRLQIVLNKRDIEAQLRRREA